MTLYLTKDEEIPQGLEGKVVVLDKEPQVVIIKDEPKTLSLVDAAIWGWILGVLAVICFSVLYFGGGLVFGWWPS